MATCRNMNGEVEQVEETHIPGVSERQAEKAATEAANKAMPILVRYGKVVIFGAVFVAIILPSLGLTAIMFCYAYSLVK